MYRLMGLLLSDSSAVPLHSTRRSCQPSWSLVRKSFSKSRKERSRNLRFVYVCHNIVYV